MKGRGKPKMKKMSMPKVKAMGKGEQMVPGYAMSGPGKKMKKGKMTAR